jgi:hypothetical protein
MSIKVGQIGKGSFGSKILSKLELIEGVEIKWVLGSKDQWWNYEAEWVIIASPSEFHYEQAKHFLKKGMNVFCEKPAAFNYEAVEELYKLASDNNCLFYVDDVLIYEHITHTNKFSYKKWGYAYSNILDRIAYHHFYLIYTVDMDTKFKLNVLKNERLEKEFTLKFGKQLYHFDYNFDWYKKKTHNIEPTTGTDALETMLTAVLNSEADFIGNRERTIFATKIVQKLKPLLYGKVAIVGAGIYGTTAAIKLADKGYHIDLFEKYDNILSATSGINQYRVHRGYHYPRSKETILSCKDNESSFIKYYNAAIINDVEHYYSIATEDSFTTPRDYLHVLDECKLQWEIVDPMPNCDLTVKIKESLYAPDALRKICMDRIRACNINLFLNSKVNSLDELSEYKYKVISTYSSLNDFDKVEKDYQFELCEKPLFILPNKYKNKSIVVMDGPFMCFDPYGFTKYHVGGNVVHAIHSSNIGKKAIVPPAYKNYINKGIIKDPKLTNVPRFIESAKKFFPDIEKAIHVGSMYTVRTVLPNKDDTDARPTIVEFKDDTIVLFSGKVGNCVAAAEEIASKV